MDPASTSLSSELGKFFSSSTSTFTCGGVVHFAKEVSLPKESSDRKRPWPVDQAIPEESPKEKGNEATPSSPGEVSPPVSIRWDSSDGGSKILFPCPSTDESLNSLIEACVPAEYGHKGKSVLNHEYRNAMAMSCSVFDTSFCPYRFGIVDAIGNHLLPAIGPMETGMSEGGRIVAELDKLNIYSKGGHFKKHVDTPRDQTQFGSLVVCLPLHHTGGQLCVRHAGQEMVYDWTSNSIDPTTIQWTAFYSDCEHEIWEVTSGHRVTLTYNLFRSQNHTNDLGYDFVRVDPKSLPVYPRILEALQNEEFMPDGGKLGIYCAHAYTSQTLYHRNIDLEYGCGSRVKALKKEADMKARTLHRHNAATLKGTDRSLYAVLRAMGLDVKIRPVLSDIDQIYDTEDDADRVPHIGRVPGEIIVSDLGGHDSCDAREIVNAFGKRSPKINWINTPVSKEVAMFHLTYGNEPGGNVVYASRALLVDIPSGNDRKDLVPVAELEEIACKRKR